MGTWGRRWYRSAVNGNFDSTRVRKSSILTQLLSKLLEFLFFRKREGFLLAQLLNSQLQNRYFCRESSRLKNSAALNENISVPKIASMLFFVSSLCGNLGRCHSLLIGIDGYWTPSVTIEPKFIDKIIRAALYVVVVVDSALKSCWILA